VQALIVAGGDTDPVDAQRLVGADLVIAADGGAVFLETVGRRPDVLVGDLDSIDAALVERLAAAGVAVERHPAAKDATDAELAIDRAVEAGARRITVIGAFAGKRLDHELANLLLLTDRAWAEATDDLRMVRGGTTVRALHGPGRLAIEADVGATVSLLPLGGDATGVLTTGLRFPLDGEPLRLGRSRGLSNEVVDAPASVALEAGVLLVVETDTDLETDPDTEGVDA
jgi:thiamine pyrophosphokinase